MCDRCFGTSHPFNFALRFIRRTLLRTGLLRVCALQTKKRPETRPHGISMGITLRDAVAPRCWLLPIAANCNPPDPIVALVWRGDVNSSRPSLAPLLHQAIGMPFIVQGGGLWSQTLENRACVRDCATGRTKTRGACAPPFVCGSCQRLVHLSDERTRREHRTGARSQPVPQPRAHHGIRIETGRTAGLDAELILPRDD